MAAKLNPAQKRAVEHGEGPLLVLAGAGSGKTRVLVHRIARLVARGVPARAIVALTFTNKAAGEMRTRVASLLGKGGTAAAREVTLATFHAFGLGVLLKEKTALGGAFTVFDQGDQIGLVKELLRRVDAGKRFDAAAVVARISRAKNAFLRPGELPERTGDEYDEVAQELYPRYLEALRGFRALDFDDLVCEVVRLWERRKDVVARWTERFSHVLVDEYQDTNHAQLRMLLQLAGTRRNVCAVGDDDQAIYGWRGAEVRNILEFEEHFPGARVIKLEQNYRSRTPILAVANAVAAKRADARYTKTLFTEREGGDRVLSVVAPDPDVEAAWVAAEIRRRIKDEGARPHELAILYRSNGQSRAFEESLRTHGVAHRVVGGQQFYERKEVKDVLAYLRVVVNPRDEISLRRIINYPARGLGAQSVERIELTAAQHGWTLWQAVSRAQAIDGLSGGALEGCDALAATVEKAKQELGKVGAAAAARGLCDGVRLKADLEAGAPGAAAAAHRWQNVEALLASIARNEARDTGPDRGRWLAGYLRAMALETSEPEEETDDVVTLSTLHGSKGLEFSVVYLVGCEEGLLPHARTLEARATDAAPQDIEEERRLFYVGVTRAREALILTRCKARVARGKRVPRTPSRFLADLPAEHVEEREIKDDPVKTTEAMGQSAGALLAALEGLGE